MRQEPIALRTIYQEGDQVNLTGASEVDRFGAGPYVVAAHSGDFVTVVVSLKVRVPEGDIALHRERPAWKEPDYEKFG